MDMLGNMPVHFPVVTLGNWIHFLFPMLYAKYESSCSVQEDCHEPHRWILFWFLLSRFHSRLIWYWSVSFDIISLICIDARKSQIINYRTLQYDNVRIICVDWEQTPKCILPLHYSLRNKKWNIKSEVCSQWGLCTAPGQWYVDMDKWKCSGTKNSYVDTAWK